MKTISHTQVIEFGNLQMELELGMASEPWCMRYRRDGSSEWTEHEVRLHDLFRMAAAGLEALGMGGYRICPDHGPHGVRTPCEGCKE